jgi:CheY-like chemotaxis protein
LTTILHVDDEQGVRETVKLVLESGGFSVISVKDADEAAQTYHRRASSVSALIADIRLRRTSDDDSGALLAKRLKQANPNLPVIIYSAYADENDKGLVGDLILHKGGKDPQLELAPNIDKIRALCDAYEADRFMYIRTELIRLKEKYRISEADFRTLVSVLPVYDVAQTALLTVHDAEAQNAAVNPHIVIVRPEDAAARELGITRPLAVVVTYHERDNLFLAELYASPMIYAYGEERDDAINALLNSLKEDFEELTAHPEKFSPSADLARFRRYLAAIFAQ